MIHHRKIKHPKIAKIEHHKIQHPNIQSILQNRARKRTHELSSGQCQCDTPSHRHPKMVCGKSLRKGYKPIDIGNGVIRLICLECYERILLS